MNKYVIEREIPGIGQISPQEMQGVAKKSCDVLRSLGSEIQWVESFVTPDKMYCVYLAADESLIRRHAEIGGFPANRISPVATMVDPTTAG